MRRWLADWALVAAAPIASAGAQTEDPPAAIADDYDPNSTAWNGLHTFVGLVSGLGFELHPVGALEWGELDDRDVLIVMYPLQRLDPARLAAFVQAGGKVVVADDFGEAGDALSRLGLLRADVGVSTPARHYQSRLYAPIATPQPPAHPLTAGVTELVTNHPAVLTAVAGATPVLGFGDGGSVVVAGEQGTGRFVVVSDPSLFINRMLQFPGNLRFATNLLRWLDRDQRVRRVVLVRGDAPMFGEPMTFIDDAGMNPTGRAVARLNRWLDERSDWLLTSTAVQVVGGALALALAGLAFAAVPPWRRAPLQGRWLELLAADRAEPPAPPASSARPVRSPLSPRADDQVVS